ncbi:hypothetical protein GOBAR_DD27238 [Gossypium barbadense]|nr:hypothetical protein GOBAR_DD27238 [Gossypium barbadense]
MNAVAVVAWLEFRLGLGHGILACNNNLVASGQTQTVTREAPTITQAPVHFSVYYCPGDEHLSLQIRGSLKFQTYLSSYLGTMMMFDEMGICGDMDFFSAPLGEKDVAASQIEPKATVEDDYRDEEIDVDELERRM